MQFRVRIAYIEIDTHAEVCANFRELIKDSSDILVDYYLSKHIVDLLGISSDKNIFEVTADNLYQCIEGKKYDLVIIGTVHRYFNTFSKIVEVFPTAIIGHNLNFIKASNWNLVKNIFKKDWQFRLKLLLKEALLLKNKVYEKAVCLFVLDKYMVFGSNYYLPLFYNKFLDDGSEEKIRVVIPGRVTQMRRDYQAVVEKLKKVNNYLEVVFLGRVSGKELKWIQELEFENQKIRIIYFTEKVSQDVFDEWMKKADVLWCPIQYKTDFLGIEEIYGQTKVSGNIGDAIKYAKMAIFPKSYEGKYPFILSENIIFDERIALRSNEIFRMYERKIISLELEKTILKLVENLKINGI